MCLEILVKKICGIKNCPAVVYDVYGLEPQAFINIQIFSVKSMFILISHDNQQLQNRVISQREKANPLVCLQNTEVHFQWFIISIC